MAKLIQEAATISTPAIKHKVPESHNTPLHIKETVYEKRRARRTWQSSLNPLDKTHLNRLIHNLKRPTDGQKINHSIVISQNFIQTTIQYGRQQKNLKGR
jgi:hypothetical protein